MKLVSISAKNFKGLDFADELAPLTVYGGVNFAGKSARLDAVRLLILGYLPELGKQNQETFRLSSGAVMTVKGEFEGAASGLEREVFTRTWRLDGDSVRKEVTGSLAMRELFSDDSRLRVMLDANSYFALTERQRVAYVFANTKMPDGWTGPAVQQRIQNALVDLPRAKEDDVRDRIDKVFFDGARSQVALPELIEMVAASVTSIEQFEREYAVRMEKTVQGLSALRLADEKTEADAPLLALNEELLRRRMYESNDFADKKAKFAAVKIARSRRLEIQSEVKAVAGMEAKLADHRVKLADATGRLELVQVSTPAEEKELRESFFEARSLHDNLVTAMRNESAEKEKLEKELVDLEFKKECPYCGAAGQSWKLIKEMELAERITKLRALLSDREYQLGNAKQSRDALTNQLNQLETAKRRHVELTGAVSGLKDEIANTEKFLARTEGLKAEEARLAPESPELETAAKMAELQLQKTEEELRDVLARRQKIAGRTAELKRLADAELARDKAKINQSVATAAAVAIREVKAEIVSKALEPLLATANSIFRGILPSPIAYNREEIGTFRSSLWVAHHTFSGVEKALTYAAIQAALAEQAPVRLMVFDELARIHDHYFYPFFAAVAKEIERGRLDGFVGVDPSRIPKYREIEQETKGVVRFHEIT